MLKSVSLEERGHCILKTRGGFITTIEFAVLIISKVYIAGQ